MESETIQPTGFVVREACSALSHPRSSLGLSEFLKTYETPAIERADTRALTIKIRSKGTMKAAIVPAKEDVDAVVRQVRKSPHPETRNLVGEVSCRRAELDPRSRQRTLVVVYGGG